MNPHPYLRKGWAELPAVVIASGPSLSVDRDIMPIMLRCSKDYEKRVNAIAVNNTIERAPWSDVVYFGDYTAIKFYLPLLKKQSLAEWVTVDRNAAERWKLTHLKPCSQNGMSLDKIHVNGNSGAQAINVAAAFGARRILLLGFDMRDDPKTGVGHWFGEHPGRLVQTRLYAEWMHKFEFIARDAKKLGVEIINCTPGSALEVFPRAELAEALS